MRYHCARSYQSWTQVRVNYVFDPVEPAGMDLCTRNSGVDFNADSHKPQSRYHPAEPGRGNCRDQVRVNDRGNAPRR